MDRLINTHTGANGHEIQIYNGYIMHSCDWKKRGSKISSLIKVKAPVFMTKWFRKYKLDFTLRSGRPIIHLKPLDDENAEIGIFFFSNMPCSPFKKLEKDNFYDLTPYMTEFHVHEKIYQRIEKDLTDDEKRMSL